MRWQPEDKLRLAEWKICSKLVQKGIDSNMAGKDREQKRMWKSKFYDKNKVENQKECVSWQRQTEDTSFPEGAGASTRAVQFQDKWQLIQYDFYNTVHWFSLWRGKVSSEIRKRHKQGYFAKYRWILARLSLDKLRSIQGYFFEPNFCSAQHDKRKKRGMFLSFLVLSR